MDELWIQIKKFCYGFNKMQYRIISPVVLLALVWIIVRWAGTPPQGLVLENDDKDDFHFMEVDDEQIQAYIGAMTDTRSDKCQVADYGDQKGDTISLIMDFHEAQFYDLKLTLQSIMKHTKEGLVQEIILLDDGTGDKSVRKHVTSYLTSLDIKPKVKAFRSEARDGQGLSRFKASKVATGSILVFLHSDVAVNEGWLEPLIDAVKSDRRMLAVPHTDNLLSGYRFFQTPDNLINVFNWKLTTLFMESPENGLYLTTPVMTGSAFAVDKEFLESIGHIDETMGSDAGENLELSFRAWLCGGSIKVVTCSRVAVKNALKPLEIKEEVNFKRIVELWVSQPYKKMAYRQSSYSQDLTGNMEADIRLRTNYLKKMVTCTDFNTYMQGTANMVAPIPQNNRHFGKVKAKTGFCVDPASSSDDVIRMSHCLPHMYDPDRVINFDWFGRLMTNKDQCIELVDTEKVALRDCNKDNKKQTWNMDQRGFLTSATTRQTHCLVHRTNDEVHYLDVQPCREERNMLWTFIPA